MVLNNYHFSEEPKRQWKYQREKKVSDIVGD